MIAQRKFFIFVLIISLLKLWLISDIDLLGICGASHDDALYLNRGVALYKFNWLGGYNNLTLAKGPMYSIYIGLNYMLGIPLLISEAIFYLAACLLIISVLRKKINNDYLTLLLFFFLLFNPMTYSHELRRVVREGIYPALALFTLFSFAKIFVTHPEYNTQNRKWLWISGLALSCFWLTKEDGIWIMPALLFICGYFLINEYLKTRTFTLKPFLLVGAPFLVLFLVLHLFSAINKLKYNSYNAVDFKCAQFERAAAAMMRVKPAKSMPFVPVTKETRLRLYKQIPAFAELQEKEETVFQAWAQHNSYCETIPEICGEIGGGWFVWALRDAVEAKGYYSDGATAQNYYERLADEINAACDCGKLDCLPEKNSLVPPLNKSHIAPFANAFVDASKFMITLEKFSMRDGESWGTEEQRYRFSEVTRTRLAGEKQREQYDINNSMPKIKKLILGAVGYAYQGMLPVLFFISILCSLIILAVRIKTKKIPALTIVTASLLIAMVCRIVILALVHITSFPAISTLYMAPVYPLFIAFVFLAIFEVYQLYADYRLKNREERN